MHIGIDLGTTFSCAAYVDADGQVNVIPSSDDEKTTPSIIWFDGNTALVGKKANLMKSMAGMNHHIYEFVKRDMGKPIDAPAQLAEEDPYAPLPVPYEINGFKYGAAGMVALILKKIKIDAIQFLKSRGLLDSGMDAAKDKLDAVITVPAYFGDKERQDTRLAGLAAGLNVIGIINEPTAAALTYGFSRQTKQKILVFDLGGGTFDVTILEMNRNDGEATVLATGGDNTLGGKNWDELIQDYLYNAFYKKNGREIPVDKGFYIQEQALKAKFALTEKEKTRVNIMVSSGDLNVPLFRAMPKKKSANELFSMDDDDSFYFEERSLDLISRCRIICHNVVEDAGLAWRDIDEVVLAGGSCRMPMVHHMLEELTGREIAKNVKDFDYDTAIAMGAALYGQQRNLVTDVVSHSIGVKVKEDGRYIIDRFIKRNTQLPVSAEKEYPADANAVLAVYEGESRSPDECALRGRIELNNPETDVKIIMQANENGILKVVADYPPQGQQVIEIKNETLMFNERLLPLTERIKAVNITL